MKHRSFICELSTGYLWPIDFPFQTQFHPVGLSLKKYLSHIFYPDYIGVKALFISIRTFVSEKGVTYG
jgi:hypothetical protein